MTKDVLILRHREIKVDALAHIVATRSPESVQPSGKKAGDVTGGATSAIGWRRPSIDSVPAVADVSPEVLREFAVGGWSIVPKEYNHRFKASDASQLHAPVYRTEEGTVLLGTDRLTIRFQREVSSATVSEFLDRHCLIVFRRLTFARNLLQVRFVDNRSSLGLAADLMRSPLVQYAEPELLEALGPRQAPDPLYSLQWQWLEHWDTTRRWRADISASEAWARGDTGENICVAVIDLGFDLKHPDLGGPRHPLASYFRPSSGDADIVLADDSYPVSEHGTFAASMAIARANNGAAGRGAAPDAVFFPIACVPDQVGTQATLARAVAFAADPRREMPNCPPDTAGADVLSCSLGTKSNPNWRLTSVLDEALSYAADKGRGGRGTLICWATFNGRSEVRLDEVCAHPLTIAVGRSTINASEGGSAYGAGLEMLAPGVDVYGPLPGGRFDKRTGTSFATPIVAGVAALILGANRNLDWRGVRHALRSGCDRIGPVSYDSDGWHPQYGFGRVNALRSVKAARLLSGPTA